MAVVACSSSYCHGAIAADKQEGWDSGVEIDWNSCDRNEECSVLKGLASTPEVCFRSLIRTGRVQSV